MELKNTVDLILSELRYGLNDKVIEQVETAACQIISAKCIACFGVGREGLMMKALAMRLYHLGLNAHVVGDMTTPALGAGDLLFLSAGPGNFSTTQALAITAQDAGSKLLCITATPSGGTPTLSDKVIYLPAQTMATDQNCKTNSVLPMGSLYEGLMFIFFEILVLKLSQNLAVSPELMRSRHTNLE